MGTKSDLTHSLTNDLFIDMVQVFEAWVGNGNFFCWVEVFAKNSVSECIVSLMIYRCLFLGAFFANTCEAVISQISEPSNQEKMR